MKVLIYNPFVLWYYHFATDLEIALKHIKQGDEVNFLACESSLSICELNDNRDFETCFVCNVSRNSGLRLLDLPPENIHKLDLNNHKKEIIFPEFTSFASLKDYYIEGVDFGWMVMSSVISKLREPKPDYRENKELIEKYLMMAVNLYYKVYELLEKIKPDIFYIFNGRFAVVRPALRAARKLGIKTFSHERSGIIKLYTLAENTLPHDLAYFKAQVEAQWNREDNFELKKSVAENWYIERKNRVDQSWYSFAADQSKDKLPENFATQKRNIVIFNSSEDEMEGLSELWHENFYKNSEELINKLLTEFNGDEFHFYLRIHPNLKGISNSQTETLKGFKYQNLTVLQADDNIDTYALIDACEKVITFYSTTGIEANFWDKPAILLGHSYYEDLGVSYRPGSYQEFFDLIKARLQNMDKTGALKFGYYMQTYGYEYQYYKPKDLFYGEFLGKDLTTNPQLKDQQELFEIVEDYLKTNLFNDFGESVELISIIVNNPGVNTNSLIESIIRQKYTNWELIFCGIKSTGFAENEFPRISFEPVFQKALEKAKGKYVLLLDCDKILFSSTLNYFINNFRVFENGTKLIYGDFIRWDTAKAMYEPVTKKYDSTEEENLFSGLLFFETAFLKKELLNFSKFFPAKYRVHKIELPLACQLDNITNLSRFYGQFNQAVTDNNIVNCQNILAEIKKTNHSDPDLYLRYGNLLVQNNEFEKAIPEYTEAVRLGLKSFAVFSSLAFCLEKTGDKKTAEQLMIKANKLV